MTRPENEKFPVDLVMTLNTKREEEKRSFFY